MLEKNKHDIKVDNEITGSKGNDHKLASEVWTWQTQAISHDISINRFKHWSTQLFLPCMEDMVVVVNRIIKDSNGSDQSKWIQSPYTMKWSPLAVPFFSFRPQALSFHSRRVGKGYCTTACPIIWRSRFRIALARGPPSVLKRFRASGYSSNMVF